MFKRIGVAGFSWHIFIISVSYNKVLFSGYCKVKQKLPPGEAGVIIVLPTAIISGGASYQDVKALRRRPLHLMLGGLTNKIRKHQNGKTNLIPLRIVIRVGTIWRCKTNSIADNDNQRNYRAT
jgi:hypothetical protein